VLELGLARAVHVAGPHNIYTFVETTTHTLEAFKFAHGASAGFRYLAWFAYGYVKHARGWR
jgi:hypothetical protein